MTSRKAQKRKKAKPSQTTTAPRNASKFRVSEVPKKRAIGAKDQVADPMVTGWFCEIELGSRVPEQRVVPVAAIRSNPYVLQFDDELITAMVDEMACAGPYADQFAWLLVARLPDGGYVDVDTPHPCEAVKRAGRERVKISIIGTFSAADCERIGIPTSYPCVDPPMTADGIPLDLAAQEEVLPLPERIRFPGGYPPREESEILEEIAAELAAGRPVSADELPHPESDPYPELVSALAYSLTTGYVLPEPIMFGDVGCGRSTLYLIAAAGEAGIDTLLTMAIADEPPEGDIWNKVLDELEPKRWRRIFEVVDRIVSGPGKALIFEGSGHAPSDAEPVIEGGIGGATLGTIVGSGDGAPFVAIGTWWEGAITIDLGHEIDGDETDAMFIAVTRAGQPALHGFRDELEAMTSAPDLERAKDSRTLLDSLDGAKSLRAQRVGKTIELVGTTGDQELPVPLRLKDARHLVELIDEAVEVLGW